MRRSAPALVPLALALAWCLAQLLDSGWIAAAVCAAAIPAACLPALGRRSRRRATALVLVAIAAAVAALVAPLLLGVTGERAMELQVGFVLVLAPLVPIAYAATFPDDEGDRP